MNRFVRLEHDFLRCPSFQSATGNAKAILIELLSRHNGKNNGNIFLSFRDAETLLGLGQFAYSAGLRDLQSRFLIEGTSKGKFFGRLAATWRLTMIADKGQNPTREYLRWQPASRTGKQYASYRKTIRKAANGTGKQYANGLRLVLENNTHLESLTRAAVLSK